jgi:O-antigen/teichoic acid export membrane protein
MAKRVPEGAQLSLRDRAVRGVAWSVLEHWAARVVSVSVFVVLARLLDPSDFGLVALSTVFIHFLSVIQEQGFGHALVQRRDLDRKHVDSALWFGLATGLLLTLAMQIAAGPISRLLGQTELEGVLRWLSISFLIGGFAGTPTAILRRELKFRPLALRTITAAVIGGAVGITLAVTGFGVWALVAQALVTGGVAAVILWTASGLRPSLSFSWLHVKDLFGFGMKVAADRLLTSVSRRGDDFLVGVFLGPVALGFYSVAYRILTLITELFTRTISTVALPTFSRMQDDRERLLRGFYSATRLASLIAFPAFVGIAVLAPEIVVVVFGPKWEQAIPVMRVLAFIGILHSIGYFNNNVMMAIGKPHIPLGLDALNAVLNVSGFLFAIAMGWGIFGVAAAYVIRGYLVWPIVLRIMRRLIGIEYGRYFKNISPSIVASAIMAAVILGATGFTQEILPVTGRLLVGMTAGMLAYAGALLLLSRELVRELKAYFLVLFSKKRPA